MYGVSDKKYEFEIHGYRTQNKDIWVFYPC